MDKETCIKERNHVEMIKHPDWWPSWPLLPIKRVQGGDYQLGFIISEKAKRVYLCNVYKVDIPEAEFLNEHIEYIDYDSVEKIVEDGWVVD